MHKEARDFLDYVKRTFPAFFVSKRVLDVGGGDINGNNRFYFENCMYDANDLVVAPNVTIVSKTSALQFVDETFDTIISSECFEHDMEYAESFRKIIRLLKPSGLFCFTCASTGRAEHGTRRSEGHLSLVQRIEGDDWKDYYKNLTSDDVREVINCDEVFSYHQFYYNGHSSDLYFVGIKKPPSYHAAHVVAANKTGMPAFDMKNDMSVIFDKHDTDKNSRFHNYPYYYHRHLERFRKQSDVRFLEIGVREGGSLRAFRDYFNHAVNIVGIDIDPKCKASEDISRSIYVEIGSQSDAAFLKSVHEKHGPFDIIVDDGSHIHQDMVGSFQVLFPLMNNGGLYIIEDTVCVRDNLDYFHGLTRHLHHWGFDAGKVDHCVDPWKLRLKVSDPVAYSIGEITFSNSSIFIVKDVKHHWIVEE